MADDKNIEDSYETFRALLQDHAPLPWQIIGGFVCDANGHALLGCMVTDGESARRVLGAVITGWRPAAAIASSSRNSYAPAVVTRSLVMVGDRSRDV